MLQSTHLSKPTNEFRRVTSFSLTLPAGGRAIAAVDDAGESAAEGVSAMLAVVLVFLCVCSQLEQAQAGGVKMELNTQKAGDVDGRTG